MYIERCCRCCCSMLIYCCVAAAATVRHRVPGAKNCCRSIESGFGVFCFFIQTRYVSIVPLAVLSRLRSRFTYITSSVITAEPRRASARRGEALLVDRNIKRKKPKWALHSCREKPETGGCRTPSMDPWIAPGGTPEAGPRVGVAGD